MVPFVESKDIQPILVSHMVGSARIGLSDLAALGQVRRSIRALKPDIVETHMSKAGVVGRLAARLEGTAIVLHVYHGHVLAGYFGAMKSWAARRTERALAKVSDHLVAVSARVKHDLVHYGVAGPERISVVEPGLDMSALTGCREQRGALRRELGIAPGTPLVGMVGRMAPIKNHGMFLDAAVAVLAARPDARFLVVGDGELGSAIRTRAAALNLTRQTIFTGWRDDLPRVYADLDVLALCSRNEGAPIALIEAMAAGCPVVATSVGGVADLVDDRATGLLVPSGDAGALAGAILELLCDDHLAQSLAASAQRQVPGRFSMATFASNMDALYQRLLRDRALADAAARTAVHTRQTEDQASARNAVTLP